MRKKSQVQKEIQQTKPFQSTGQEAVVGLFRTADVVKRYFEGVLSRFGVTLAQYNVLRILRGAGDDGLPTLEIANRMIETTPGITRLLDRLEAKGLIWRERCPSDRRQVTCRLTRAGNDLLAESDSAVRETDTEALGKLAEEDLRVLVRIMDAIRAAHTT